MADRDIYTFVSAIGATMPSPDDGDLYTIWKSKFKRSNYFFLDGNFMIVKISRSPKPIWGVGKQFIDFLNECDDYRLVLLCSPYEGWAFVKSEINAHIRSGRWKLSSTDYKINSPLSDHNSFSSPEHFLRKWSAGRSD